VVPGLVALISCARAGDGRGMRPGCSRFRRVCLYRVKADAAACSMIAGHRCRYLTPMARNHDVSPAQIPPAGMGKGNLGRANLLYGRNTSGLPCDLLPDPSDWRSIFSGTPGARSGFDCSFCCYGNAGLSHLLIFNRGCLLRAPGMPGLRAVAAYFPCRRTPRIRHSAPPGAVPDKTVLFAALWPVGE
jgi:hypothetical protein